MTKLRVMRRTETGEMREVDVNPLFLNDEMVSLIGTQSEPQIMEVERGAIRRYAQAIEDPNLLYNDFEYARKTKYGEIICPPGFFGLPVRPSNWIRESIYTLILNKAGPRMTLMGNGGELELMIPVRAGDILTLVYKIIDIYEEVGRSGNHLILIILEAIYINQNGDTVAKERCHVMCVPAIG